jgi:hypothetical protein
VFFWPSCGVWGSRQADDGVPGNPVDYAEQLAESIPLLNVVCRKDPAVPPAENTEVLAVRYRQRGGTIDVHYNQTEAVSYRGHISIWTIDTRGLVVLAHGNGKR